MPTRKTSFSGNIVSQKQEQTMQIKEEKQETETKDTLLIRQQSQTMYTS